MLQLKLNVRLNKNFPKIFYIHRIDCIEYLRSDLIVQIAIESDRAWALINFTLKLLEQVHTTK